MAVPCHVLTKENKKKLTHQKRREKQTKQINKQKDIASGGKYKKKLFQKNIENSHDHLRESWLLHGQEQQMDLNPLFNPPKIH